MQYRYYLRNLCDEARFPGWPLVDHVQLMQVATRGRCMPVFISDSFMLLPAWCGLAQYWLFR
jgi:hypothetical protein